MPSIPILGSLFSNDYPPSAFYFKVVLSATAGMSDTSFQEGSGISSEVTTEGVSEGGENRYLHKLPKGVTHSNLELKRGIASRPPLSPGPNGAKIRMICDGWRAVIF